MSRDEFHLFLTYSYLFGNKRVKSKLSISRVFLMSELEFNLCNATRAIINVHRLCISCIVSIRGKRGVYFPRNGTYCFLRIWIMHTVDIGPAPWHAAVWQGWHIECVWFYPRRRCMMTARLACISALVCRDISVKDNNLYYGMLY